MSYNGWSNYETWCVHLWLTNEEGSCRALEDMAREAWEEVDANGRLTREERAGRVLAEQVKEMVEEGNPLEEEATMYHDLLGAALSEVNWQEIACSVLNGVTR